MSHSVGGGDYIWERGTATGTDHTAEHLRARVLGGGSAINAGAFVRAPVSDFDRWVKRGLTDWSFDKVLPWFKALESADYGDDDWHGRHGPVPVRLPTLASLSPASRVLSRLPCTWFCGNCRRERAAPARYCPLSAQCRERRQAEHRHGLSQRAGSRRAQPGNRRHGGGRQSSVE